MNHLWSIMRGGLVGAFIVQLASPALAQDDRADKADKAETGPPTRADFLRLQGEVREQRSLIIQMLQTEQQRYDMLLRLMQGQPGLTLPPSVLSPTPGEAPAADASAKAPRHATAPARPRSGTVQGKVTLAGGSPSELYVYVENVHAPLARNKSLEVKQEGKQFVPRVAVVQTGTSVVFPNFDNVFHNVFSNSPRNTFDLGSYRAGDKPKAITLAASGVVDVFCNFHHKMSASILVVPSPLFTRVHADGTFRLNNVPVGTRKLVAWSPHSKPAQLTVEVAGGDVVEAPFDLQAEDQRPHLNKFGQAYGSYRD
jgi:plastocyanin